MLIRWRHARDRLSVGVDCLSINAVGATTSSVDPPVRASPRDRMSVCLSVNDVGTTASIVDLSDKVCLQDISSVCLSDQTSDACYVAPRHVASETFAESRAICLIHLRTRRH